MQLLGLLCSDLLKNIFTTEVTEDTEGDAVYCASYVLKSAYSRTVDPSRRVSSAFSAFSAISAFSAVKSF